MIKKNGGLFGRNPTFNDVVVEGTLSTPGGDINTGASLFADIDGTLAANSDLNVATQKAVKTYVDNVVTGLLDLKGNINCSGSPNYPAALKGDAYVVSVAGKIGGASGITVAVGDVIVASADNAGGTQAAVGASWFILEHNLDTVLLAANNLSDLTNAAIARTNLGLGSAATTASTDYAPAAKGVTNGDSHDHNGGDGAQIAYSSLSGLPTLGTAAAASTSDFAPAAQGVTNGNSHDHNGGDGAQIAYSSLSGLPTLGTMAAAATSDYTKTGLDTTYAFRSNNLSDLANAGTARTNLGLGSIATQAANNVSITGGSISGLTLISANANALLETSSSGGTTLPTINGRSVSVYAAGYPSASTSYRLFKIVQGSTYRIMAFWGRLLYSGDAGAMRAYIEFNGTVGSTSNTTSTIDCTYGIKTAGSGQATISVYKDTTNGTVELWVNAGTWGSPTGYFEAFFAGYDSNTTVTWHGWAASSPSSSGLTLITPTFTHTL